MGLPKPKELKFYYPEFAAAPERERLLRTNFGPLQVHVFQERKPNVDAIPNANGVGDGVQQPPPQQPNPFAGYGHNMMPLPGHAAQMAGVNAGGGGGRGGHPPQQPRHVYQQPLVARL